MDGNFYSYNESLKSDASLNRGKKAPSIKQVSMVYSIVVFLFLLIGSRVQQRNFYTGVLVTEFFLILLPPVIYLLLYKYDVKNVLRLNKVSFLNILLVFLIMVFALPLVGVINLANLILIKSIFGKVIVSQPPVATDSASLILNILIIGGSAGICEEVLFRGTIQRGFEKLGVVRAILITSLLFGLMHVDFQKLLGTFLLGALIGFIVYRTNSLFSGMFAHFTNNSMAVVLAYASNKYLEMVGPSGMGGIDGKNAAGIDFSALLNMPRLYLIIAIVFWSFIILFCATAFLGLVYALIKNTPQTATEDGLITYEDGKSGFAWTLPGVLTIAFLYFAQGLKLKGISIQIIEDILRLIGVK